MYVQSTFLISINKIWNDTRNQRAETELICSANLGYPLYRMHIKSNDVINNNDLIVSYNLTPIKNTSYTPMETLKLIIY